MVEGFFRAFQITAQAVWADLVANSPQILGALAVLFFGTLLAATLGLIASRFVRALRVDQLASQFKVNAVMGKAGIRDFSVSRLVGWVVKWFFVVVVFLTAADLLGWTQLTEFLTNVAMYLPKVLVAVLILLAGTVLANFISQVVRQGVTASKLGNAGVLSAFTKWLIIVFAVMAALVQLEIAKELTQILFTGLVGMISLAGGLAFGLGGKDAAKDFLDKLRRNTH